MTIPISTIKNALHSFVVAASGLSASNVVFAYQNAPEPSGTYISIIPIITATQVQMYDETIYQENGTIDTVPFRNIVTQLDAYGTDAISVMSSVMDNIDVPSIYDNIDSVGLSAMLASELRNLTELKGKRYEQRAGLDLRIYARYSLEVNDDLGWFNIIKYDGGAGDPYVDRINEQTITGS